MAIKEIVVKEFDDIARGTSVTIPVLFKRLDDTPFDLTPYTAQITIKGVQYDFDYEDLRARVAKPIDIEYPEEGRFDIQLSSHETWLPPGDYYFDIELERDGAIARVALFKFKIVGGVSNRQTNRSLAPIKFSHAIEIQMDGTAPPIVLVTDLISDPPENLIETIQATPAYLLEHLDPPDEPIRNVMIHCYAPLVSFVMSFSDANDALPHAYRFENFSFPELPEGCPLKDGALTIDRRELLFTLSEHSDTMKVWDTHTMHSPMVTTDATFVELSTEEPFFVGDNVTHGAINIIIEYSPRRMIHIHGNYTMPRYVTAGGTSGRADYRSHWVLRVDYFDWPD